MSVKGVIKKVSDIQGIGKDLINLDDVERNDYRRRRGGSHGLEKQESEGDGQQIGIRGKTAFGKVEEPTVKSEKYFDHDDDRGRGRRKSSNKVDELMAQLGQAGAIGPKSVGKQALLQVGLHILCKLPSNQTFPLTLWLF